MPSGQCAFPSAPSAVETRFGADGIRYELAIYDSGCVTSLAQLCADPCHHAGRRTSYDVNDSLPSIPKSLSALRLPASAKRIASSSPPSIPGPIFLTLSLAGLRSE